MDKIQLKSCKKEYTYDQDKAKLPEETVRIALERLKRYNRPLIEKFYKVENEFGIPVYRIECSKYAPNEYPLFDGTWGKGVADPQAQASCIMEFIERYSASRYKQWFKEKYTNFASGTVLPMESWGNSLDYSGADTASLLEDAKETVLYWGKAYNLTTNEYVFVPKIFHETCTTGMAAGNTLEEALLQAMCECVERHVSAHVYRHHGEYPTIDKTTIKNKLILNLIKKIEIHGIEITIKDFSSVTGIPAIGIILTTKSGPKYVVGQSLGVCPDKEKALMRTLTEQVQGATIYKLKPRLGGSDFFHEDNLYEVAELTKGKKVSFADVVDVKKDDIKEEIDSFLNILKNNSFEPLFIDLTDAELQIPVVWVYLKNAFIIYKTFSLPLILARATIGAGEYVKGIEYLTKGLEKDSNKCALYYNIGYCYNSLNMYEAAASYYEKAYKEFLNTKDDFEKSQDDFLEHIYSELGSCYLNLGRYQEAADNFEKAKGYEKRNAGVVHLKLGLCYYRMEKYREALDNYEEGVELDTFLKEENVPNAEMGICCLNLNMYDKAITYFDVVAKLNPDDALAYHFLGVSYMGLKKHSEAIESFKKGIELNDGDWNNYNLLGATYREQGDYKKAIEALQKAIEINPEEWRNYNVLGNTYIKAAMKKEGVEMLKKALLLCDEEPYQRNIIEQIETVNKRPE